MGIVQAQGRGPASIALDQSRPYVEIAFDHYAERLPVFAGESRVGIWLRLRNNCIVPIKVDIRSGENRNLGLLLTHDVVEEPSYCVFQNEPKVRITRPIGYMRTDVRNSREIEPGADLLFSVPISHVTRKWSIRVEVELLQPVIATGRQPRTFVDFDWDGLSPEARKASDALLLGSDQPRRLGDKTR